MRALVNADRRSSGQLILDGKVIDIASPADALQRGIVYVSEDRKGAGLFLSFDVASNLGASALDRFTHWGMFSGRKLRQRAAELVAELDVRPTNVRARVVELSGGNQQKVLLGAALNATPKVLIVDEPTRGVDIGAKSQIHQRLRELAKAGVAVVIISSEMPEVIGLSDRILVFRNGGISQELDHGQGQITQETVMQYAAHV